MITSPSGRTIFPTLALAVFISVFILFGIMEFRHTRQVIGSYEAGIMQYTLEQTVAYQDELKTAAVRMARLVTAPGRDNLPAIKRQAGYWEPRLTGLYILDGDGTIVEAAAGGRPDHSVGQLVRKASRPAGNQVLFSGVHRDPVGGPEVVTLLVPLGGGNGYLAASFYLDQYQNRIRQLFAGKNYRIAVFDGSGYPLVWPFEKSRLAVWDGAQDTFHDHKVKYSVVSAPSGDNPWRIYFFFASSNFELYRAIAVLLLVFALYICLYELLVEFWGVNEAKTYFENIDFAIFNQIHDGVIIANNSGRIIFANQAAHQIFAGRKSSLRQVRLSEVLGSSCELPGELEGTSTITINAGDRLFKAIHSPIIKHNKILGSLTVLRSDHREDGLFRQVLDKLLDVLPQGVVFVNREDEVVLANLMAKCYLSSAVPGSSIETVDRWLAEFIHQCTGTRGTQRVELSTGAVGEVTPVYDHDGVYAGTLVVIPGDDPAPPSQSG
ncbi:MAG: PAS domain-containing protein [Desulfurispora sp.]|uniref:PAS domain-containing protein n=1 Tax=Desulfurispora sp. TaxID=3014275 RepID=UPI00404AE704